MIRKRKIIECMLCLILSACMVGPDYERPQFFDNEAIEKALELKVGQFDESVVDPFLFQDETLNNLFLKALKSAPDIRSAYARIEQAHALLQSNIASVFPSFDIGGGYNYKKTGRNMGTLFDENIYQAGLSVAWEVDLFGQKRRAIEAGSAKEREMIAALKNIQVSLISDVATTYLNLRMNEKLCKESRADLKIQQALYDLTLDKYHSGLSNAIELNQARYQLENVRASIPKLEEQIELNKNALALLVGVLPGQLDRELNQDKNNLITKTFKYDLTSLNELSVDVVYNRPDVMAAEEQLIGQNAAVGQAVAEMLPSVNLSAFFGFESLKFPKLFHNHSYAYGYEPTINAPVFHFGALYQNLMLQKAIKKEQQIYYEQVLLQAINEIKNALISLNKEFLRYKALDEAWQKMDEAAQLARDKYKSGLIDYFVVLDAEERRISAQANLTTSAAQLYKNVIAFYRAIGGSSLHQTDEDGSSR